MNRTRLNPDAQLEASLLRIRGALQQNRNEYAAMVEQIVAATGVEVAERVTARIAERHQRRIDRWQRRKQRGTERRRHDPADVPRGLVSAVAAVACLVHRQSGETGGRAACGAGARGRAPLNAA